jgi:hypothetical protein
MNEGEDLRGLVERLAEDLYIRPPRNPPHEKDAAEYTRGSDRALARGATTGAHSDFGADVADELSQAIIRARGRRKRNRRRAGSRLGVDGKRAITSCGLASSRKTTRVKRIELRAIA